MSDPIIKPLYESICKAQSLIYGMTNTLTEANFYKQPSPNAPSIGWHVFHVARIADMLQASFPARQEVWDQDNLIAAFGLEAANLGLLQHGATLSAEDATRIPIIIGKERLMRYARTVFELADTVVKDLTLDDLYTPRESIRKIDWSATPLVEGQGLEVMLIEDIMFHSSHTQRHQGMIEALIGATLDRPGTATV